MAEDHDLIVISEEETPSNPQNGLERYLASLELPQPGDAQLIKEYEEAYKTWRSKGEEIQNNRTYDRREASYAEIAEHDKKRPVDTNEVIAAHVRNGNEVLRKLLPNVVEICTQIINRNPAIDITEDNKFRSPDYIDAQHLEKRKSDLLKILAFEPYQEGKTFGDLELRYTISMLTHFIGSGAYEKGVWGIIWDHVDPRGNGIESANGDRAGKALVDNAKVLLKIFSINYGLRHHDKYSGQTNPPSLDFWARRIDPDYWTHYENMKFGISPTE